MNISVFGLGYVGTVSSVCLAELGHNVIGVDVSKHKVDCINKGYSHIQEKGIDQLIREQFDLKKLIATIDAKEAVLNSEISFVCVGTPPKNNGDIDLTALKNVCTDIGMALKEKSNHIIIIRSTMFPGTLEILKEIIEINSGKKCGKDFDILTNPEFLREGTAIKDFFHPPYVVIGTDETSDEVINEVLKVYEKIDAKKIVVKSNIAMIIKYVGNSYHALKVSFTNEIAAVCKELNIDSKQVMDLFCEDNQLNISPYYFKPGFAFGGSCLPKDLAALNNNAKRLKVNCPVIDSISKSNLSQIERAISLIENTKSKKIGILGITFKADTDDIRGNPIISVINRLLNKKYNIKIFDNNINNIESINQSYRKEVYDLINRENLKTKVNNISNLFSDIDSTLNQDIIIISRRDKSLKQYIGKLKTTQILIDLQNIFEDSDTPAKRLFC